TGSARAPDARGPRECRPAWLHLARRMRQGDELVRECPVAVEVRRVIAFRAIDDVPRAAQLPYPRPEPRHIAPIELRRADGLVLQEQPKNEVELGLPGSLCGTRPGSGWF